MAGKIRTGSYLPQQDINLNPQEHGDRAFPDIPKGYSNFNEYVLDVIKANEMGAPGPRPYGSYGQDQIGDPDVGPAQWLQHTLGYARLAPWLDQSDPRIQQFLDNQYYAGSSYDQQSFLGDQFGPAVALLGLGAGGAAAFGALGAGAGAAAPAAASAVPGAFGGAAPFALGGTGASVLGGAAPLALSGAAAPVGGGLLGGLGLGTMGAADWLAAAGLAAGVGNTVYSGIRSNKASNQASDAANLQAQIAAQLFNEASPLRGANLNELAQFAQTGQLPTALRTGLDPLYATGREGLESQYNVARENLLSQTPSRGGQLNRQLAELERARASSVGRLQSDILGQYELPLRSQLFNLGVNTGLGQSTQGLQGLGTSAQNFMGLANTAAQQYGQAGQSAGGLLALLLRQSQQNVNPLTGQTLSNPTIGTGLSTDPFAFSNVGYQLSPEELAYAYR
jgi:hypothetical protein